MSVPLDRIREGMRARVRIDGECGLDWTVTLLQTEQMHGHPVLRMLLDGDTRVATIEITDETAVTIGEVEW